MIFRNKIKNDVRNGTLSINERNGISLRNDAGEIWILSQAQVQLFYGGTIKDVTDYIKYVKYFSKEASKNTLEFL